MSDPPGEPPVKIRASHTRPFGFTSWLCGLFQLPANADPGRHNTVGILPSSEKSGWIFPDFVFV